MEISILLLATLLVGVGLIAYLVGKAVMKVRMSEDHAVIRKDAITRSRAVLTGQISEQLAPYLPNFPYKPSEVRFIGKPVDFLVFEGMDEKSIRKVVFVEVKSGNGILSPVERTLRSAVQQKQVVWEEYRVATKQ